MGNVNEKNMARERMKSGSQDLFPGSPLKETSAFTFDKRPLSQESSQDEESGALSRSVPPGKTFFASNRVPFSYQHVKLIKVDDLALDTQFDVIFFCLQFQVTRNFLQRHVLVQIQ